MRWSTLPPLVVAIALLIGAASQYPDSGIRYAFGGVGFVVLGVWLCLEVGTEIAARWRRSRAPGGDWAATVEDDDDQRT